MKEPTKDPTAASLEQIRTILTGEQERENKQRFDRVEARLSKDYQSLQKEVEKLIADLSTEFYAEVDSLQAELAVAAEEAAKVDKSANQKLAEIGRNLDSKIAKLSERTTRLHKQISEEFKAKQKALRDELITRCDELGDELETGMEEIRATMVNKEELSSIFAEIALKLVNRKQIRLSQ